MITPPYCMHEFSFSLNSITWLTFYRRFYYLSIPKMSTFLAFCKERKTQYETLLQFSLCCCCCCCCTYLAKIVVINSRVIFFLTLSGWATYHFWSRSFPCRLNNNMNNIIFPMKTKLNRFTLFILSFFLVQLIGK